MGRFDSWTFPVRPLWLCLAALPLSCATQTVVVDGTEMSVDEAGRRAVERAEKARADGDPAAAESHYRNVLELYPKSRAVPEALDGLARLKLARGGCDAARYYDDQLLDRFPRQPQAQQARQRRSECAQGNALPETTETAGDESLRAEYRAASTPVAKAEVARRAARTAADAAEFATAVLWGLEVLRHAESDPIREQVETWVEGRLSARGLRLVLERSQVGRFPHESVSFKLAKVLHHVGEDQAALEQADAYLEAYPEGRFAEPAQNLKGLIAAAEPVLPSKLGILLPMSGKHQKYGELAMQAIEMALKNAPRIERVVVDTRSDPVVAAEQAEALVREHHVVAILGPIFTYAAEPSAVVAQRYGVPLLTVSAAADITKVGPFVFRNGLTNARQIEALVDYAMSTLGFRRFAILYPRHPFGEELLHLFWDEVEARRGEIRGVESYGVADTTFTSQVQALVARDDLSRRPDYVRAARECQEQPDSYRQARCREDLRKNLRPIIDFDALFIPDYPRPIAMITAALAFEDVIVEREPRRLKVVEKTLGRKVTPITLLGTSGWNSDQLIERARRNVENAVFTDGFFADQEDPAVRDFVTRYREAHGRTPRLYPEALLFDSAQILAKVFSQGPKTRAAFRDALQSVVDHPGVTGTTSFGNATDATKTVHLLTIQDGEIEAAPPEGFEFTQNDGSSSSGDGPSDTEGFGGAASESP